MKASFLKSHSDSILTYSVYVGISIFVSGSVTNFLISIFYNTYFIIRKWIFCHKLVAVRVLTLSRRRPLSYRNKSIDLQSKSMYWFPYDSGLRHERVKSMLFHISCIIVVFILEFAFRFSSLFVYVISL